MIKRQIAEGLLQLIENLGRRRGSHAEGFMEDETVGPVPMKPWRKQAVRVIAAFPAAALRDAPGEAPLIEWPESEHSSR